MHRDDVGKHLWMFQGYRRRDVCAIGIAQRQDPRCAGFGDLGADKRGHLLGARGEDPEVDGRSEALAGDTTCASGISCRAKP